MWSSYLPFLCLVVIDPVLFKAIGFCDNSFNEVQQAEEGHMINQC